MKRDRTGWLAGALAAVLGWGVPAFGAAPAAAPGPAEPPKEFKEESIYIPYEKLREVFEKEGRGVFLPYERFLDLWKAARDKGPRPPEIVPPVDSLVTEVSAAATVSKDVVTVKADVKIEVLKEGWNEVPLRLGDAAITRATLDGEPARLTFQEGQGYRLLVEKKGKDPKGMALVFEFAKAYAKAPGQNSVSFECPPAPVSRWDVRIGESGVKVNIHPLLAATEAPAAPDAKETRVLAFVGAAPTVRIEWTPKATGAKGLEALASVKVEQQVTIDEGVTRTRAHLVYDISRAELGHLLVEVPADQKVAGVFDANVREWSVEQAGQVQRVTVNLFEPARASQSLVVELEKFLPEGAAAVTAPVVRAVGVGRQQGVVVVRVAAGLRAEPQRRTGLLQLDPGELPAGLAGRAWDFSYRYAALPWDLALRVEKIQPRILVDSLAEVHLQPESLTLDLLAVYDVQRAGVFRLALEVPAGYEVREVRGVAAGGAAAVEVDSHHLEEGPPRRLLVNLSRKALGKVALAVRLHQALREPDLLAPTGKAARILPPLPRARDVERESGRLVVYAPESLRITPVETKGLRTVSHNEAVQGMRSTRGAGQRPVLSFAYAQEAVALGLDAERRKPYVTVGQLLIARIEAGVVKYTATFFYDIRYSGVKALRIDVPAALAADVRVTTAGIRDRALEGAEKPETIAAGYVAWGLEGETELMGATRIVLVWEKKIEKLDVGKSVTLPVPRLIPARVDRAWGQVVLAKAETIDVAPADVREGLRPIDPQHDLMEGTKVADAARAFEFHDAWALAVKATRYEPEDVKATSIERALVRMVLTRTGDTSVQTVYRMRSARQRLALRLPAGVSFDAQPLRLNGRPKPLERGEPGEYFVPLVGQNPDEPFLLELRYVVAGAGGRLECPTFPDEPAVQCVYLSAYVPQERVYLGMTGPWNPELGWHVLGFSSWPEANRDPDYLLGWVTQGLNVDMNTLKTFQTDGRHLLYKTLSPPAGAAGALRLYTLNQTWFSVAMMVLVVGVGGYLLRERLARRVLVIGAALVGLILLAVFLRSLALAVVNNATAAAAVVVVVVWVVWHFVVTRPRDPALQAWKRAREEARLAEALGRAEAAKARVAVLRAKTPAAPHPKPPDKPAPKPGEGPGQGGKGGEGHA